MSRERSTRRGKPDALDESTLNLSDEQLQEFKAAFHLFAGGGERLDAQQLSVIVNKFGIKADAKQMIAEADTNKEGSIDFAQFGSMMAAKMAKSTSEEDLLDAFGKFDWQKKGSIPTSELSEALQGLAKPIKTAELQEFLDVCEKEGQVDYRAFIKEMFGAKDSK